MRQVSLIAGVVFVLLGTCAGAGQITYYLDERGRRVYVNADPAPQPPAAKPAPESGKPESGKPEPGKRSILVRRDPKTGELLSVPAAPKPADAGPQPAAPPAQATAGSAAAAAKAQAQPQSGTAEAAATTPLQSTSLDGMIREAAQKHDVDPNLVRAIIKVESNFNPYAVSRKGARGLMQLMPQTARSLGVRNLYDPGQNINGGVRYLKQMLETFPGKLELSLAAYNAGPAAVERHGGVPPYTETKQYVNKVSSLYGSGLIPSPFPQQRGDRWGITKYVDARGRVHFSNTEGW